MMTVKTTITVHQIRAGQDEYDLADLDQSRSRNEYRDQLAGPKILTYTTIYCATCVLVVIIAGILAHLR